MKELALNILDIVQNSIRAKARQIEIQIEESEFRNLLRIVISDDGIGIPPEMLANVVDPYITSRTIRKVGMGLAFLKQHAEFAGGRLKIDSSEGKGTRVETWFLLNHIDRQPMGDISGVVKILIVANPLIEFLFEYKTDIGEFRIDTTEIKEVFKVKDLTDNNLMGDIRGVIEENLKNIGVNA
jgi:anti-sigma regulatory factor (Ser/Thr protein kinase)